MILKIVKSMFLGVKFTECVDCKHRKNCDKKVWLKTESDDCEYNKIHNLKGI